MRTLIKNIKELVQVERQPRLRVCGKDMAQMETIKNAYLIIEDDKFAAFGPMSELKELFSFGDAMFITDLEHK